MLQTHLQDAAVFVGALHLVGPLAVGYTMRAAAHCKVREVPFCELPADVAALLRRRIPEMEKLGFEALGCYDGGELASETHSCIAYLCNRGTNDYGNAMAQVTPTKTASYFEFSTCLRNGLVLETNTNGTLPLTPENPELRVFRFPKIEELALEARGVTALQKA